MPRRRLVAPTKKPVTIAAVHANVGIEAAYRKKLDAAIARMAASVHRQIAAVWRTNPPELAEDASPSAELRETMERLHREWQASFDDLAETAGRGFARAASDTADRSFAAKLKKAGFSVPFQRTRAVNDVIQASVSENVQLIKSIPAQYLTQVESIVTTGVQNGRDMGSIASALQQQIGVTKRRAALIARDQSNKATAAIVRTRQQEVGITHAIWLHSLGGRKPRPTHVAANGKPYEIAKGMWDSDEGKFVWPGELINCFPGDMPVTLENGLTRLWRSTFNGPMIHIYVGSDLLKGTPNHPILTDRGWIALGNLECGDNVVCVAQQGRYMVDHHKHQAKIALSDLFEACSRQFGYVRRDGRRFDFHGDVANGDVDEIVIIDENLLPNIETGSSEDLREFRLAYSDSRINSALLSCPSHFSRTGVASLFDASLSSFSTVEQCPSNVRLAGRSGGNALAHQHRSDVRCSVAGSSERDSDRGGAEALIVERNDTLRVAIPVPSLIGPEAQGPQLFAKFVRIASDSGSGGFQIGSRRYELRRVTDKSVGDFSGHVFTLATRTGFYGVGDASVQAKNCRCVSKAIIPGLKEKSGTG